MTDFDLKSYPRAPGVYLMKDTRGVVLYVGKANILRDRLRSYVRGAEEKSRYQIHSLMKKVASIEVIVTQTEKEALLLEHTLIQRHKPRYNIWFRDDKTYISIKVTTGHDFPAIYRTRRVKRDDHTYFGPYTSGAACKETVETLIQYFRLRNCTDREFANRSRPCLQYQIGRCTAPCVGFVSTQDYAKQVDQALLLLRGKQTELIADLTRAMHDASAQEKYEEAARIRDLLADIQTTIEQQRVIAHGDNDRDLVGFAVQEGRGSVAVIEMRDGKVTEKGGATVPMATEEASPILESFLLQFYRPPRSVPPEIFVPVDPASLSAVQERLAELRGGKVRLHWPQRGEKARLLALATTNAEDLLNQHIRKEQTWEQISDCLTQRMQLPKRPEVIECVDISNWQGTEAVGALVCFAHGEPDKQRYRHYNIRGPHEPNDYLMMYEVLSRRMERRADWPLPDLLLIDGGKGHLQVGVRVLQELGLIEELLVASIAKAKGDERGDKIYIPGRKNPVTLKHDSPALLYLQRVRDEAHRFGITHQRERQRKRLKS